MVIKLDFASDLPIYQQIRNAVVIGIAHGTFKPGEKLPAIRALADEAGVNMMTVDKAYQLLRQEGYIQLDRRSGAMITGTAAPVVPETLARELALLIAQAKLSGVPREGFFTLCGTIFDEMEDGSA